jgi:hypothetical protein
MITRALTLIAAGWLAGTGTLPAQVSYRGLWVGQATLNFVNEVSVPLDENNVAIAPDPKVTTPTADQANLRLILHVNGAGQVELLKDVAILNRKASGITTNLVNLAQNPAALTGGNFLTAESDMALVTDERLYGEFPPQPALRIASAVFDFGDSRATDALDAVLTASADAAATSINTNDNVTVAKQAAISSAAPIVQSADVAAAFDRFLNDHFTASDLDAIAAASQPDSAASSARAQASLLTNNFYGDTRAVEMVDAVVKVIPSAGSNTAARIAAAHNSASSFADLTDNYQRFIAGQQFGDMIAKAAEAAATATTNGSSIAKITDGVDGNPAVDGARFEALRVRVTRYNDTRAPDAVERVLNAVITNAAAFLSVQQKIKSEIQASAEASGRRVLELTVRRYPLPTQTPTTDYTDFIRSSAYQSSAATAAEAAANGALSEKRNNALYTPDSLKAAAKVAAATALRNQYGAAARAIRHTLPMAGTFGLGQGDPRFTWHIKQNNSAPLSQTGALAATIYLPANHPTNPFRHRRHPDHTTGFDITRKIRLDFNGPTNFLARAGYGVDRISGIYREEISGLHKPLGPNPGSSPIGLKVEGTFVLNRISLIDALNAR